jgi:hypothetical protein
MGLEEVGLGSKTGLGLFMAASCCGLVYLLKSLNLFLLYFACLNGVI